MSNDVRNVSNERNLTECLHSHVHFNYPQKLYTNNKFEKINGAILKNKCPL